MLRLSIISSVIPLALAGSVAHDWTSASAQPCFGAETSTQSIRRIAFTDDPAIATVKVQLVEAAELADLVIAEDTSASEAESCGLRDAARSVYNTTQPVHGEPVVYLSRDADADYRVYVDLTQISARQAAALIVGARGGHTRLAARPADDEATGALGR